MFKNLLVVGSVLFALMLTAGCGKAPETELQTAQANLEKAQLEEIDQYAPELYNAAVDSLNASKVEMEKQDSKFSLLRGYGKSEELIDASNKLIEAATTEAMTRKEEVKIENETLMSELSTKLETATKALASAPKGKGTKADLELMKAELASINETFKEATLDHESGKYMAAKNKFTAIDEKINVLIQEVEVARAKVKPKAGM